MTFFKLAPKLLNIWATFARKFVTKKELLKEAQSGHTYHTLVKNPPYPESLK